MTRYRFPEPRSSEITPKEIYRGRRNFLRGAATALGALTVAPAWAANPPRSPGIYASVPRGPFATDEELTPYEAVTEYNNFYEFGTGKDEPARNAHTLKPRPWSVTVDGEVAKPLRLNLEDILAAAKLEERVYRLRCVEGWSMVIPWVGFTLGSLLRRIEPTSKANYVEMTTLMAPEQMPGQRSDLLPWPYVEALRMDEAMHPLTILAVGLYGEVLPNQNGAPLRLVVPWKYGFKSVKSIVRIRLTEKAPKTTWNVYAPKEYGFLANVNPAVSHPRWSQARERRIGAARGLRALAAKRETAMFNGYAEQVAGLYAGMDLRANF